MNDQTNSSNNRGLTLAIVFAAVAISGSLVFFGMQLSGGEGGAPMDDELLAQKVEEGIQKFTEEQIEEQKKAQQDAVDAQARGANEQAKNVKAVSKTEDHIRGNLDAKISLIEYSDFECPFCKRFHPTPQQVIDDYDGNVNWVYRHFPLGFHDPLATKQAEATECVNELGGNDKFWEYTDLIYTTTVSGGKGMEIEQLTTLAGQIGIDENKFQECLDSEKYLAHVKQDIKEGSAAGVTGTPGSIVLNNETGDAVAVSGAQPVANFKSIIDNMI